VDKFSNKATSTEAELFSIASITDGANVATPENFVILKDIEQKIVDTVVTYNNTRVCVVIVVVYLN
jgi:hypothetical protein